MSIESALIDLIEGRRHSYVLLGFLYLVSLVYETVVRIRNVCYDQNLFTVYQSSLPVVSVGNLVAGGTGKTPLVQKLVDELSQISGEIAIVTRGYRSQAESGFVLASCGEGPLVSVRACGDEAYWLALKTKASLWVGKNRLQSLFKIEKTSARLVVLEDGFQHRKISRDVNIVLLSAKDLLGKGFCLPRGYLREPSVSLCRADWIVVTHIETGMDLQKIEQTIRVFSSSPIIGFSARYTMKGGFRGKKIGAFCGIAKPEFFYDALRAEGNDLVKMFTSADHTIPSSQELDSFASECQRLGAEALFCTEKDLVKLEKDESFCLPIETLSLELVCVWNENIWKEMVHSIHTMMNK